MAGKKIIYVEDEAPARNQTEQLLKAQGYEVTTFTSVDKAMEHMGWQPNAPQLTTNLPDLIITDNNTPGVKKGLDLLRAAKDANIPRIMLAAYIDEDVVKHAGGHQARLIYKPYEDTQLLTALSSMLAIKSAREL